MTKTAAMDRLVEMEQKYRDLVWLARSTPDQHGITPANIKRITEAWPTEVAALSGEGGQWQHGFNSGCLAAFRLAMGLLGTAADAQAAEDDFPFLDT
jgi:hypothetical protein